MSADGGEACWSLRASECQQLGSLGQFLALKKYQLALKNLAFPIAFQADDDGSIPFTRSNLFNALGGSTLGLVSRWAAGLRHCAATPRTFSRRARDWNRGGTAVGR